MKTSKIILGLFILIILTTVNSYAQQQFTQTVTADNKSCNNGCSVIDVPELNGNPAAIIFITPLRNSRNLNPHPIGAYFMYLKKWSVFNLDGTPIVEGAKFNVEYFVNPDANHFVYVVPQNKSSSCIDHDGLNGNPNAQIRVFPTVSPTIGALYNRYDVKVEYNASALKWCIANVNGNLLSGDTAYNIMFSGGAVSTNPNASNNINTTPQTQVSTSPTPITAITNIEPTKAVGSTISVVNAGGDLSGFYPNPKVIGLQGNPLSNAAPKVGQILKWNGSAWIPTEPSKTFFKDGIPNTIDIPSNTLKIFPDLSQTIVLTTKSRLIISGMITIMGANYGPQCPSYDCKPSNGFFEIQINGNRKFTLAVATPGHSRTSSTISNYMIDLYPGTYNVEFGIRNTAYIYPQSMSAYPLQSSIMVIPLE